MRPAPPPWWRPLARALAAEGAGLRVLYPASSRALPTIAAGLRQLGAEVLQVEAYRTEGAALDVAHCRDWIARRASRRHLRQPLGRR